MNTNDTIRSLLPYNPLFMNYKSDSLLVPFNINPLNNIYESIIQRNLVLLNQQQQQQTSSTNTTISSSTMSNIFLPALQQQQLQKQSASPASPTSQSNKTPIQSVGQNSFQNKLSNDYQNRFGQFINAAAVGSLNNLICTPFTAQLDNVRPEFANDNQLVTAQNDATKYRFLKSDEPKPSHSYIGLIAMAILSSPDKKLVLSDIYQWIMDNYMYFRTRGPGRSANGKGHYWAIHPANLDDFSRGDFRRRRAQRRVRKSLGLITPEEEEEDEEEDALTSPSTISPVPKLYDENIATNRKRNYQNIDNYNSIPEKKLKRENNFDETVCINNNNNNNNNNNGSTDENISTNENSNSTHNTTYDEIDDSNVSNYKDLLNSQNQSPSNNLNEVKPKVIYENNIKGLNSEKRLEMVNNKNERKRCFDVDILLAPDKAKMLKTSCEFDESQDENRQFNTIEQDNQIEEVHNSTNSATISNSTSSISQSTSKSNIITTINNEQAKIDSITNANATATALITAASFYRNYCSLPNNPLLFYHLSSLNQLNNNNSIANIINKTTSNDKQMKVNNTSQSYQSQHQNQQTQQQSSRGKINSNSRHSRSSNYENFRNNHQYSPTSKIKSDNIDVEKWKQTFSKIMARSYKNHSLNISSDSSKSNNKNDNSNKDEK